MTSPQHVCCTSRGFGADIENEAQQAPPLLEALMEQVARRTNKKKDKRPQLSAVLGVLGNCKWRREWEETTLAPLIARLHEPTFGKASVVQRRERDGGMQGGQPRSCGRRINATSFVLLPRRRSTPSSRPTPATSRSRRRAAWTAW